MKTAIVIGATGLIGKALVQHLLGSAHFSKVVVLGRRSTGVKHPKLEEHVINFDAPDRGRSWCGAMSCSPPWAPP